MPDPIDRLAGFRPRRVACIPPAAGPAPAGAWTPPRITVQLLLHGRIPFRTGAHGRHRDLRAPAILVAAGGAASTRRFDVAREHLSIAPQGAWLRCLHYRRRLEDPRDQPPIATCRRRLDPALAATLEALDHGLRAGLASSALDALARAVPELARACPGEADPVAEVLAWLAVHCHEELDRPTVARHFGWHPDHLGRLLRSRGLGFVDELERLRCRRALALLAEDDEPTVAEVAQRCGFASATYFIRRFRHRFGCTPAVWRRDRGARSG